MRTFLWSLVIGLGVTAIACGGGGDDAAKATTPEDAIRQLLDMVNKGQWGREWDILHPAQQALVPRDQYITCAEAKDIPNIDKVEITEVYDEDDTIPGTDIHTASKAVTVKLDLSQGLFKQTTEDTYHVYDVEGVWRWALSAPEDYANDKCPDA